MNFRSFRDLIYFFLGGLVLVTTLDWVRLLETPRQVHWTFFAVLLAAFVLWGLWVRAGVHDLWRRKLPFSGLVDVVLANGILTLLAAELIVTTYQRVAHHPLLWDEGSARSMIETYRSSAVTFFGFPMNSGGYHDEEFVADSPERLTIALVGDSIAYTIVPFEYGFPRIAEKLLGERLHSDYEAVSVDNYGVVGIGPREYVYLLETEVLPRAPDLIVVSIFVGNDIDTAFGNRTHFSFRGWSSVLLARRLLDRDIRNAIRQNDTSPWRRNFSPDPADEEPRNSEETYLRIELRNLEAFDPDSSVSKDAFADFFGWLGRLEELAGKKLIILIIPDEFQVDEEVWEKLMQLKGGKGNFQRELAQQRILAYCQSRRIPCLDLLPLLRESENRPYHLRDFHLNAVGNRLAGTALAEFLERHLDRKNAGE